MGFGEMGFGEMGFGEVGFGEVGFGEMGGHLAGSYPLFTHRFPAPRRKSAIAGMRGVVNPRICSIN